MITVIYRGRLAQLTQKKSDTLQAKNVKEVLLFIRRHYGAQTYKEAKRMLITLNQESILLYQGYQTRLQPGDVIAFFPMAAGG